MRGDDPTGVLDSPKKRQALPKTLSVENVTALIDRARAEADEATGLAIRSACNACGC